FESLWTVGEPILIECSPDRAFKMDWSPTAFRQSHGQLDVDVYDSQTFAEREYTLDGFLKNFGQYENRSKEESWQANTEVWRVKEQFAAHSADFVSALPLPMYLCPRGPLHLLEHYPSWMEPPDVYNPIMQFAKASNERSGTRGAARLVWAGCDTVDMMTYAAPAPNGDPGSAIWDIFRGEDSEKARLF
ncbi:hypothetical protein GYMLUDRAFT_144430, partial [Collybiopsis luxurians FD-317 M1]